MIAENDSFPRAGGPGPESPTSNHIRQNNFNFLRLLFSSSVILSHSAELVDGSDRRELLVRLFNSPVTISYLAVEGFFLLSGYLITQSWLREPHLLRFLWKRVLRIYPGFVVAILFSAWVIGPLGGNPDYWREFDFVKFLGSLAWLTVDVPRTFDGTHYAHINGSTWTIPYEFLCYLITAALGCLLLLRRRRLIVVGWVGVMAFYLWQKRSGATSLPNLGYAAAILWSSPRLVIAFMAGSIFFLFRDRIRYHWIGVIICLVALLLASSTRTTLALFLPILWGYIVFFWAFADSPFLRRFARDADVSYGIYLYAWPVQILIVYYFRDINPYLLSAITLVSSYALGTLSWYAVERPFLRLKSISPGALRLPRVSPSVLPKVDKERA